MFFGGCPRFGYAEFGYAESACRYATGSLGAPWCAPLIPSRRAGKPTRREGTAFGRPPHR
jgi:hypothetical protein